MKILIIILILLFITPLFAEENFIVVKDRIINLSGVESYRLPNLKIHYVQEDEPSANEGDIWTKRSTGELRILRNSIWEIVNITSEIKSYIQNFKEAKKYYDDNITSLPNGIAKNLLQALYQMELNNARVTLHLYKEALE